MKVINSTPNTISTINEWLKEHFKPLCPHVWQYQHVTRKIDIESEARFTEHVFPVRHCPMCNKTQIRIYQGTFKKDWLEYEHSNHVLTLKKL
jgi:hypothetical protein